MSTVALDPQEMPTQRLLSGLYVPENLGEVTAPIDVVDRPAEPEPKPEPLTPSPAPVEVFRPENPTPAPAPVTTSTTTPPEKKPAPPPAPPTSAKTKKASDKGDDKADDEITTGAFVAVCAVTVAVAGLAFALSFDMMLTAARHYGWGDNLSKLFPIIIDVGAIGGTFMGAISANRVYRQIGHQVLIVTLAASVLFNLVGHDIRGKGVAELPEEWAWTGTGAAVLIPLLLAYFVHAFSKALKTYTDQRRAAAEKAKREQHGKNNAEQNLLTTPTQPKPAAPKVTKPTASKPKASSKRKTSKPSVTPEQAKTWSEDNGRPGPTAVIRHFREQGYATPSVATMRRWLNS